MKLNNGLSHRLFIALILVINSSVSIAQQNKSIPSMLPGSAKDWKLIWSDEFNYENKDLDKDWESQNGPSGHILSSRWRDNAIVSNGTLKLINKKEQRGGQNWTSGNIWTKQQFMYGYYECRYKYAAAEGTNNSFWLMTKGIEPKEGKRFEIDINEGHFPNEIATNIHNWSDLYMKDGKQRHPSDSKIFNFGTRPDYTIQLEIPISTTKIRFSSTHNAHFNIGEFNIYNVNSKGYPDLLSNNKTVEGLINFSKLPDTKITVSGQYKEGTTFSKENMLDGKLETRWTSQAKGEKWIEFEFAQAQTIGCIKFVNGWLSNGTWQGLISNYKVEYWNGKKWVEMSSFDLDKGTYNFAKEFHTYGLEWTKDELVFYFDGKEIRREKNTFCWSPSPIWLSLAIIPWAGNITDAINGTQMEVDYVRVYQRK